MALHPILLVEDNADDVELTRRAFKRANIINELVVAADGVQALEYLHESGVIDGATAQDHLPTVILLDLQLPRMGGIEVLQRIRDDERTRSIPVIILTSSREEQDIIEGYGSGANSYIRKPVEFEEFVRVVQQVGMYWLVLNELPPEQ